MIHLSMGCSLNNQSTEVMIEAKEKEGPDVHLDEVYGSWSGISSARAAHRLPSIPFGTARQNIKKLQRADIKFCLTMNSPYYHPEELTTTEVHELIHISDTVILANPFYEEFIHQVDSKTKVTISTIFRAREPYQIEFLKDRFDIDRITLDLYTRERPLLDELSKINKKFPLQLLTNEFCSCEGHPCVMRNICYLVQSMGDEKQMVIKNTYCSSYRRSFHDWLNTPALTPFLMWLYNHLFGFEHFKITGRTGTLDYQREILKAYMHEESIISPNMLISSLWSHKFLDDTVEEYKVDGNIPSIKFYDIYWERILEGAVR